jgi:hypothetical protein
MELRAGVALAVLLESMEAELPVVEVSDPAAGAHLEELFSRGLADLRGIADRAFSSGLPPHARARIAGPEHLAELLTEAGLLGRVEGTEPGARVMADALEAVQAPLVDLLDRGLERVRAESLALRAALTEALRALGPAASRLEKLDAALAQATERDTSSLLAGLAQVGAEAAEQILRPALSSLPPQTSVEELQGWFEPRGPLPQAIFALRRVLVGVLDFERRRLEALVQGCRSAV